MANKLNPTFLNQKAEISVFRKPATLKETEDQIEDPNKTNYVGTLLAYSFNKREAVFKLDGLERIFVNLRTHNYSVYGIPTPKESN